MRSISRRKFTQHTAGLTACAAAGILPSKIFSDTYSAPPSGTGYVYDPLYLQHQHPTEQAERLAAINQIITDTRTINQLTPINPEPAPLPSIQMVHTDAHITAVQNIPVTGTVAIAAAGGVLGAVNAVCEGRVRNAFCAIRPPGHHAHNSGMEEGFCFFSNVAIAVNHAQSQYPELIKKVAIIDWDYHHGNGTEDVFYSDGSVLFFSTHNWNAYPATGDPARTGNGAHAGLNINVHMPCLSGDSEFVSVWDSKLLPAMETFHPDLILISAGFDSKSNDLLGCFELTPNGYSLMTKKAMEMADMYCSGRLVSVLEGGYADRDTGTTFDGIAQSALTHVQMLLNGEISNKAHVSPGHGGIRLHSIIHDNALLLSASHSRLRISIYNASGKQIHAITLEHYCGNSISLSALPLASGRYSVHIAAQDGQSQTIPWIKK